MEPSSIVFFAAGVLAFSIAEDFLRKVRARSKAFDQAAEPSKELTPKKEEPLTTYRNDPVHTCPTCGAMRLREPFERDLTSGPKVGEVYFMSHEGRVFFRRIVQVYERYGVGRVKHRQWTDQDAENKHGVVWDDSLETHVRFYKRWEGT